MERMTYWSEKRQRYEINSNGLIHSGSITDRLAEYENIKLEPEEIKDVLLLLSENQDDVDDDGISMGLIHNLFELMEYREAEEQGLSIKLPCKIGDTVWDIDFGMPVPSMITGFSLGLLSDDRAKDEDENEIRLYSTGSSIENSFLISEIGKTVFLTREEAEEALKGGIHENRTL